MIPPVGFSRPGSHESDDDLANVERLRGIRSGFDPAHSQQPGERLATEPGLVVLRTEMLHHEVHLAFRHLRCERNEDVRETEITLVLGDLVLGDEMVPERVPYELSDRAVVLVLVVAVM